MVCFGNDVCVHPRVWTIYEQKITVIKVGKIFDTKKEVIYMVKRKKGRKKSRRTTYRKKSSAQKARKKGQSIYKVKGGYRLTKKR